MQVGQTLYGKNIYLYHIENPDKWGAGLCGVMLYAGCHKADGTELLCRRCQQAYERRRQPPCNTDAATAVHI